MDNVVSLVETGREPVANIIETLEALLVAARAGNLRAIAVASVRVGDRVGTLWERPPNGEHGNTLAAAIGYLVHRYSASMLAEAKATNPDGRD